MSLPTELAHEVAERAPQPGFDAVVDRARTSRTRRRRTTFASGLAAAAVVAGTAVAIGGSPTSDQPSPAPAPPGLTDDWDGTSEVDPRLPSEVRDVLGSEQLDPDAVVASGGAVAALWRSCPGASPCRTVVVAREGDRVAGLVDEDTEWALPVAVPGGWLLWDHDGFSRLTPTGDTERIYLTGPGSSDVVAGDTAVTSPAPGLLRGDKLIPFPAPADAETYGAYVTPEGRLVSVLGTPAGRLTTIAATGDGRAWEQQPLAAAARSAMVSGNGDHVAVALLGDAPDGSIQVEEVLVSHDAGRTWTAARGLDTTGRDRVRNASSLAVGAAGTAYLTTESHGLVRIDVDGNAMPTPLSEHDTSAFALGGAVCVVAEAGRVDELRCSTDDGTTWFPQPLPGFR